MNIYTIYCRMLVLAVMTLLMAVNLSQTAFAYLHETTKNPMQCLVHHHISSVVNHELRNICDETLNIKIVFESRFTDNIDEALPSGESVGFRFWTSYERGFRWGACFDGERIDGLDDFDDTDQFSCVAE